MVVLPAPLGPSSANTVPALTREVEPGEHGPLAEGLRQSFSFDCVCHTHMCITYTSYDARPDGRRPRPACATTRAGAQARAHGRPAWSMRAAVALADADGDRRGLDERASPSALGFTTMSLYRHVRSKDELRAADDQRGGRASRRSILRDGDWRARLEHWSWDLLEGMRRHPWLLGVPLSQPAVGARAARVARPRARRAGRHRADRDEKAASCCCSTGTCSARPASSSTSARRRT